MLGGGPFSHYKNIFTLLRQRDISFVIFEKYIYLIGSPLVVKRVSIF